MKEQLFSLLFKLREDAEKEKARIDEIQHIADTQMEGHKDKLDTLQLKLSEVQESIKAEMKSESVKTYNYADKNVTLAVRKTLGISDDQLVVAALMKDKALVKKLSKISGLSPVEIKGRCIVETVRPKEVKELAQTLLDLDGTQLPGTELKETEYLTIK